MLKFVRGLPLCILSATALLYGCIATYKESPAENQAQLKFVNQTDLPVDIFVFRDSSECRYREKLAAAVPSHGTEFVRVPAAPVAIGLILGYADELKFCRQIISFHPDQTKKYEVISSKTADECSVRVVEALHRNGASEVRPVVISKREWLVPLSEAGPWCAP